ncbi:MAG: sugar ABC transporter permease [Firmicutes bacterium]|jgi:multiple sugar transport system permease protein|nr:sugar ABC transporter permease [Bacillota bacterium]MDH7494417.1 sugar ABC transporter permease [Bacillota bacterium]
MAKEISYSASRNPGPRHRRMSRNAVRETRDFYLCILPWLVGFSVLTLGPMVVSLYYSLCEYNILQPPTWVGLANYVAIFTDDPLFWTALYNTAYYTLFAVPLGVAGSLALALLLNQRVRGVRVFRTIFYMPSIMPAVASSILWIWLFNPQHGLVNRLLSVVGVKGPLWLADPVWSKPALILMGLWGIGGGMVIFLAGLQGVPRHLYEAAVVDGATPWQQFIHVTLPMLSPTLFFSIVMGIIGSFQVFTQSYVMTQGGPLNSTLFYVLYLYRTAFEFFQMGYASALAWILFVILVSFTFLQLRLSRRWVYYEGDFRR